jgi:hypothetical protein
MDDPRHAILFCPSYPNQEESEPMRLHLLFGALLLALLPLAGFAANLDDQTTTFYLTEAKDAVSGLGLTQTTQTTVKGFQPTRILGKDPLTFYTAPQTGDIAGGTWVLNLWTARLKAMASVKVEVLKTDAKGKKETVLGTSETALRVIPHHHAMYTFNVKVGPASLKGDLIALRLTLTGGTGFVFGFNANDYDSNIIMNGPTPTGPPAGSLMSFTFRNCTNKFADKDIYYSFTANDPNSWVSLDKGLVVNPGNRASGRMYIALGGAPKSLVDNTYPKDFLELNLNAGGMYVNTTQVDALVIPFTIELIDVGGRTQKMGFSESMPNMIDEFRKFCPEEYRKYVTIDRIRNPGDDLLPASGDPDTSAGFNRGVDPKSPDLKNPDKYYQVMPYNWYAKFMHIHSINDFAYGFAYDDDQAQSSFIVSTKPRDMTIAIYYADAPGTLPVPPLPDPKDIPTLATAPKMNDVVVSDITYDQKGLSAVVKNIGTAATPDGVVIGIGFDVDGRGVGWCDNVVGPLAPGASVVCTLNGGGGWRPAAGTYNVTAMADNIDRFPELDDMNNTLTKKVTVP